MTCYRICGYTFFSNSQGTHSHIRPGQPNRSTCSYNLSSIIITHYNHLSIISIYCTFLQYDVCTIIVITYQVFYIFSYEIHHIYVIWVWHRRGVGTSPRCRRLACPSIIIIIIITIALSRTAVATDWPTTVLPIFSSLVQPPLRPG